MIKLNQLQEQKQKDGITDVVKWVIAIALFLLSIFNLLDQICKGQNIIERIHLTLPFFVMALSSFFIKSEHYISLCLLICGIYSATDSTGETDFSIILFICSYGVTKNNKYGFFIIIVSAISATIRANIFDMTTFQFFNQLLAYACMFFLSYTILFKENNKPETIKIKNIDTLNISEEEKAILKLYCKGYDYAKISRFLKLNITPSSVRRKIKSVKELSRKRITGSEDKSVPINDAQFVLWLFESV